MTRKQLLRRQAELNRNKLRYTLSGTERAIEELAEIDEKLEQMPCPVCGEDNCELRNNLLHKSYG